MVNIMNSDGQELVDDGWLMMIHDDYSSGGQWSLQSSVSQAN